MSGRRQANGNKTECQEIWRNHRSAEMSCTLLGNISPRVKPEEKPKPKPEPEPSEKPALKEKKHETYPPIVTIDGRVDTDIDHLIDDLVDDYHGPVVDVPSKYPKPHMFSVIEGSLDDDVDSFANDDGTMEHTLVDAPKSLNAKDLHDVAKEAAMKSPGLTKGGLAKATDRSYNKMHLESSEMETNVNSVLEGGDSSSTKTANVGQDKRGPSLSEGSDRGKKQGKISQEQISNESYSELTRRVNIAKSDLESREDRRAENTTRDHHTRTRSGEKEEPDSDPLRYREIDMGPGSEHPPLNSLAVAVVNCGPTSYASDLSECSSHHEQGKPKETESAAYMHAYTESLTCTFTDESFREGRMSLDNPVRKIHHENSDCGSDTNSESYKNAPAHDDQDNEYTSRDHSLDQHIEHTVLRAPSYDEAVVNKSSGMYLRGRYTTQENLEFSSSQLKHSEIAPNNETVTNADTVKSSHTVITSSVNVLNSVHSLPSNKDTSKLSKNEEDKKFVKMKSDVTSDDRQTKPRPHEERVAAPKLCSITQDLCHIDSAKPPSKDSSLVPVSRSKHELPRSRERRPDPIHIINWTTSQQNPSQQPSFRLGEELPIKKTTHEAERSTQQNLPNLKDNSTLMQNSTFTKRSLNENVVENSRKESSMERENSPSVNRGIQVKLEMGLRSRPQKMQPESNDLYYNGEQVDARMNRVKPKRRNEQYQKGGGLSRVDSDESLDAESHILLHQLQIAQTSNRKTTTLLKHAQKIVGTTCQPRERESPNGAARQNSIKTKRVERYRDEEVSMQSVSEARTRIKPITASIDRSPRTNKANLDDGTYTKALDNTDGATVSGGNKLKVSSIDRNEARGTVQTKDCSLHETGNVEKRDSGTMKTREKELVETRDVGLTWKGDNAVDPSGDKNATGESVVQTGQLTQAQTGDVGLVQSLVNSWGKHRSSVEDNEEKEITPIYVPPRQKEQSEMLTAKHKGGHTAIVGTVASPKPSEHKVPLGRHESQEDSQRSERKILLGRHESQEDSQRSERKVPLDRHESQYDRDSQRSERKVPLDGHESQQDSQRSERKILLGRHESHEDSQRSERKVPLDRHESQYDRDSQRSERKVPLDRHESQYDRDSQRSERKVPLDRHEPQHDSQRSERKILIDGSQYYRDSQRSGRQQSHQGRSQKHQQIEGGEDRDRHQRANSKERLGHQRNTNRIEQSLVQGKRLGNEELSSTSYRSPSLISETSVSACDYSKYSNRKNQNARKYSNEDAFDKRAVSMPRKRRKSRGIKRRESPVMPLCKDAGKSTKRKDDVVRKSKSRASSIKDSLRAAFKVAEESMSAAARVAEAINLLMKASQISPASSCSKEESCRTTAFKELIKPKERQSKCENKERATATRSKSACEQFLTPQNSLKYSQRTDAGFCDEISECSHKKIHSQIGHVDLQNQSNALCQKTSFFSPPKRAAFFGNSKKDGTSSQQIKPPAETSDYKWSVSQFSITPPSEYSPQAWGDNSKASTDILDTDQPHIVVQLAYSDSRNSAFVQDNHIDETSLHANNQVVQDSDYNQAGREVQTTLKSANNRNEQEDRLPEYRRMTKEAIENSNCQTPNRSDNEQSVNLTSAKEEWRIPQMYCSSDRRMDSYFAHIPPVVDKNLQSISLSTKQILRRQIMGSCVDPGHVDSSASDSIEFNSNFNKTIVAKKLQLSLAHMGQQKGSILDKFGVKTCSDEYELVNKCSDEYALVNKCSDKYALVNTCSDEYALVNKCIDKYALVNKCSDKYALVNTCSDKYALVNTCSDEYAPVDKCSDKYALVDKCMGALSRSRDQFLRCQQGDSLPYDSAESVPSKSNVFQQSDMVSGSSLLNSRDENKEKGYRCITRSHNESCTHRRETVHARDHRGTSYQFHEEVVQIGDYRESWSVKQQEQPQCVATLCYTDLSSPVSSFLGEQSEEELPYPAEDFEKSFRDDPDHGVDTNPLSTDEECPQDTPVAQKRTSATCSRLKTEDDVKGNASKLCVSEQAIEPPKPKVRRTPVLDMESFPFPGRSLQMRKFSPIVEEVWSEDDTERGQGGFHLRADVLGLSQNTNNSIRYNSNDGNNFCVISAHDQSYFADGECSGSGSAQVVQRRAQKPQTHWSDSDRCHGNCECLKR